MCGRTAQTHSAVQAAAASLANVANDNTAISRSESTTRATSEEGTSAVSYPIWNSIDASEDDDAEDTNRDNYNLSPGMDAIVFWKDNAGKIQMGRKVWGLVSRGGSAASPLPQGMSKHFANLMFNARSDTLYEKRTFAALANAGKSCLIAVDGFFEWKTEMGKKQPYFVYRNTGSKDGANNDNSLSRKRPYLLLAGLWTSVSTGWPDQPTLDTFTILTTDVCEPLQWLHTRMPVTVWDERLATAWLERPSPAVHRQLDQAASRTPENILQWHAVTPDMSSMKFRTADAVKALPKMKTVKSFFTATAAGSAKKKAASDNKPVTSNNKELDKPLSTACATTTTTTTTAGKRAAPDIVDLVEKGTPASKQFKASDKKAKTSPSRPIDSFFKPKSSATKK
jgi:putative SOS response-associated peptidase YedK